MPGAGKGSEGSRNIAWNIAGVVTPVAAITLGAMAFATTSDIPVVQQHREEPANGRIAQTKPAQPIVEDGRLGSSFSAAYIAATRAQDDPLPLAEATAAPVRRDPIRQDRKPAAPNHFRVAIVAHPEAADPVRVAPAIAAPVTRPVEVDPLSPPKLTNLAAKNTRHDAIGETSLATVSVRTEPDPPQQVEFVLASAPERDTRLPSDTIRRDYSRTLSIGGASRDVAVTDMSASGAQLAARPAPPETPAIATIRDKMAAVRKVSLTKTASRDEKAANQGALAEDAASVASGTVAEGDMAFADGKLTAVRIGALLDVVKSDLGADAYAAFSNSRHADSFVSTEVLRDAGINADGDPATGRISLSSRD